MAFEEIREKIFDSLQGAQSRLEEEELYQKIRERYELLPPIGQKALVAAILFLFVYILFQIPMGYFSRASENLALFEENRDLVLELYRVKRKSAAAPPAQPAMDNSMLESRARSAVLSARVQNDQIKAVSFFDNAGPRSSRIIPKAIRQNGVEVRLANLNLTQIVDIGHGLSNLGSTTKIVGFDVKPGSLAGNYFDVVFKVVTFDIPAPPAAAKGAAGRGK